MTYSLNPPRVDQFSTDGVDQFLAVACNLIRGHLLRSADRIATRLRKKSLRAWGVQVKLKTASFQLRTRQMRLTAPTDVAAQLYIAACALLDHFQHDEPYRLVGISTFDFSGKAVEQMNLFTTTPTKNTAKLEQAVDRIAERFGKKALVRANDLSRSTVLAEPPNRDGLVGSPDQVEERHWEADPEYDDTLY